MRAAFAAGIIALSVTGCAHAQREEAFSRAKADTISAECGASPSWITIRRDGEVMFQPPPDANYDVAACVLREMTAAGVKRFGFIGNQAVAPTN